jgi:hypothetical protein
MRHALPVILLFLCFFLFLPGCKNYEEENKHLIDELRMVREESDYLKAEIVGLKKELAQLSAIVQEEREGLQKRFEDERNQLQKKLQEERELMHKRIEEATKAKNGSAKKDPTSKDSGTVKKDSKDTGAAKKETKEPPQKTSQPYMNDGRSQAPKTPLPQ